MGRTACFFWVVGVCAADQVSKWLAERFLILGEPFVLTEFLNLTLLYNRGAAFSFLAEAAGWQRWFFVVLALVVDIFLIRWFLETQKTERFTRLALSLLFGGATGNLLDRLFFGHVIDFIDLHYLIHHYPAFNIADFCITLGAIILFWATFGKGEGIASSSP